jgi:uncharacterized membrane protein
MSYEGEEWTMTALGTHLQNKFMAGALAVTPVLIVVVAAVWLEEHTQPLSRLLGLPELPGLGVLVAIIGVYLLGVVTTSLVGSLTARVVDYLLQRIPGFNLLYRSYKDVLLLPPGKLGVYNQVVIVPTRDGGTQIGFTSGDVLPGERALRCVFVPSLPNPLSGQLVMYPSEVCQTPRITVEEAFKFLLSSGNYVPPGLST